MRKIKVVVVVVANYCRPSCFLEHVYIEFFVTEFTA